MFELHYFVPPVARFKDLKSPAEGKAVLVCGHLIDLTQGLRLKMELETVAPIPSTLHYTIPKRLCNEPESDPESVAIKKARLEFYVTGALKRGKQSGCDGKLIGE